MGENGQAARRDRAARRQRVAREEEHDDDDEHGQQVLDAGERRLPLDFGNQLLFAPRYSMSGTCIPSTNAASVVRPNDEKPPTSAAVSAGTISTVSTTGSIVV